MEVCPVARKLILAACPPWMAILLAWGCAADWVRAQSASIPAEDSSQHPATAQHADMHVRYAEARLRLAETRLHKAEQLNAISPGLVAETDMRSLRTRIDLLRTQVAETRSHPHGYAFTVQRRAARSAVHLAEQQLAAAAAVNDRKPDAIPPLDMRLLELRLEIARLRAEIWDDPAFLASPTDVLQMQVDQLADQLHDVLQGVDNAPAIDRR